MQPAELAVDMGKHPDTVARWLRGKTLPNERTVADALRVMGLDPAVYGVRATRRAVQSEVAVGDAPAWAVRQHEETMTALGNILNAVRAHAV